MPVRNYERYRALKELADGRKPSEIADRVGCHFTVVYSWIKRFNQDGFRTFERPPEPEGRVSWISGEKMRQLIRVALARPEDLGLPFTTWSVRKLNRYCASRGYSPKSPTSGCAGCSGGRRSFARGPVPGRRAPTPLSRQKNRIPGLYERARGRSRGLLLRVRPHGA